jgi:hypothetical protein
MPGYRDLFNGSQSFASAVTCRAGSTEIRTSDNRAFFHEIMLHRVAK